MEDPLTGQSKDMYPFKNNYYNRNDGWSYPVGCTQSLHPGTKAPDTDTNN